MKTLPDTESNNLPHLAAVFQPSALSLEQQVHGAPAERTELVSPAQFEENMTTIADGR